MTEFKCFNVVWSRFRSFRRKTVKFEKVVDVPIHKARPDVSTRANHLVKEDRPVGHRVEQAGPDAVSTHCTYVSLHTRRLASL